MHEFSFLASTTSQHGRVFDCQMLRAPGDGTTPPKDSHCKKISLVRSRVHCLEVTGLVDGALRDATGSPDYRPDSCSSTKNMSVTHVASPGCPATQHSQELTTPKCY
ncbi:hypothetical protein CgunFtcFv8_017290 [Champsocephalus gunnari]|uniref:Uncharacterized protein n=1 Tax=Champsocephalus gunnari TaxID=52237 RepID=A0AAN8DMY4_CHAGU|nr:hypothetical protein CgunFtcFv8_017290 [Champsocephalus gunnari]